MRSIANAVFEVKDGRVRKFPSNFDYYLEKKSQEHITLEEHEPKVKIKPAKSEAEEKAKQEEKKRREEESRRKAHNLNLRKEIEKLLKEKKKLRLESYAKARALSNPHIYRDEETVKEYGRRLKEIEKLIAGINQEINRINSRKI